ncbi:hypothetical protein [Paenibacillus planticolens]|uniref:Uncharacterized protein n=1 Tax=Paenibacillus planticolens TaxID=2654976 RepID=A0ABX1ZV41_9BACL|nr:hypothetical protein [Paenibacillus planticolens]NOV02719.1 hypothetical protein [Paenibacillus planticolens]
MKEIFKILLWLCFWPILLIVKLIQLALNGEHKKQAAVRMTSRGGKGTIIQPPISVIPRSSVTKKETIPAPYPRCPYCGFLNDQPPQRNRKCPNCKEQIYVRTDPESGHKMLLDEEGKERFEQERKIIADQNALKKHLGNLGVSESEFEKRKKAQPGYSESDILWGLFNERSMDFAVKDDWGLYRNVRLSMGEHLMREKRYKGALDMLMEVTTLDVNGPSNGGYGAPFRPKDLGFTAPGVISYMLRLRDEEGMTKEEFKAAFLAKVEQISSGLKLLLSPQQAWSLLEKDIEKAESFGK